MKIGKIGILLLASALALGTVGCSDGLIATPTTSKLVDPDHAYEIDTWGSNSEIYEFTPKSNPNVSCVTFMLDSGAAMGLQCFDKPIKEKPE